MTAPANPREILSPAIVRNGFTSFQIAVQAKPGEEYTLYYSDKKLGGPVHDYAKLFQKDAGASQAALGDEEMNSAYTGRPDDRPWSERHPA